MTEVSADVQVHALPTQSVSAQTLPVLSPASAAHFQHPAGTPVGLEPISATCALVHTQPVVGGVQV